MKGITFHGPVDVRYESVAEPAIREPTDAVVRITTSAICGSDLHFYHGRFANIEPGIVLGHEFVGRVEAQSTNTAPGMWPFAYSAWQAM